MTVARPVTMRRSGLTLIELTIACMLLGAVMIQGAFVMRSVLGLASEESAAMHYEDQARRVMDRIALAVMGSDRETLFPAVEEVHSSDLKYTFSLGLEDGEVVWSDPEEIRLAESGTEIEWLENPDAAEERRVVWSDLVSPLLEGELANGVDDNGNGLVDEEGLSFVIEGQRVTIRLTLNRPEVEGRRSQETVERIVACRN